MAPKLRAKRGIRLIGVEISMAAADQAEAHYDDALQEGCGSA